MLSASRVAVFIDGAYLYRAGVEQIGDGRLSVPRIVGEIVSAVDQACPPARLIRAYYYNSPPDPSMGQDLYASVQQLFDAIQRSPYMTLRLGRLVSRGEGPLVQKGIDMRLAMDALNLAFRDAVDVLVLVSSDGDFEPLIEELKAIGKGTWVVMGAKSKSQALAHAADVTWTMTDEFMRSTLASIAPVPSVHELTPSGPRSSFWKAKTGPENVRHSPDCVEVKCPTCEEWQHWIRAPKWVPERGVFGEPVYAKCDSCREAIEIPAWKKSAMHPCKSRP